MSDPEFEQLVTLVVEICGENALDHAMARALCHVAQRPVEARLRPFLPRRHRDTAVQIDASTLRDAVAIELRHLVRPH
ncbi:MAG TPA: hypothetical protein VKE51_32360 [Vicinamibacterales bacterium]|nr:hypothetical protein [Vicinamibacterales bacterium]